MNLSRNGQAYIQSRSDLTLNDYIQAVFIIINNKAILKNKLIGKFKNIAKQNLKFQDQDVLNIVCKDKVYFLPPKYNMTDNSFYYAIRKPSMLLSFFNQDTINESLTDNNIHYNGHKPWTKCCINFDIWWEYYRKSPFYDENFYFDFFYDRLNELDKLSLWKRIKVLIRYFTVGKK